MESATGHWRTGVRDDELGRVKGMWRHDVIRSGELVAVDYSSGAFLDRQGRPNPPPRAMLDALVAGPPHGVIL